MRSTAPNTRTKRSLQEGQAIVLIALLILVLFGMLGLAVDSGRGYVDRRDQQTAVDAAALAAGDWWDNYPDLTNKVIPAAVNVWLSDLRIYTGCPIGADSSGTTALGYAEDKWDFTCPGTSYRLTIDAINTQFNGYQFNLHSYHQLPLAFIQIFGGTPTVDIEASATSIVGNQRQTPALLTLDPTGPCSTWVHGAGQLTLYGDAYSNGPVCMDANTKIAGNCYEPSGSCSSATFLCFGPNGAIVAPNPTCPPGYVEGHVVDGAPSLPDPGYLAPEQPFYPGLGTISSRGTWNEMTPGTYNNFSLSGPGCYFLDAGVYTWNGGYSSHGGFVSNELKPPSEAAYTNPGGSTVAAPTFWGGGGGCDGSFTAVTQPAPGNGIKHQGSMGNWGVVLTSVRFDRFRDGTLGAANPCFAAPGCYRESAPSACQQLPTIDASNLGIQITINNNAPGAEYYNVYIDPLGCEPISPSPVPNPLDFTFYGTFLAPGWTDVGFGYATTTGLGPYTGILSGGRFGWTPCAVPLVTICNIAYNNINTYPNYTAVPASCAFYNARSTNCISPAYETAPQCFPNVCFAGTAPQENARMDLEFPPNTGGDLANENYCVVTPTTAANPPGDPNAPCATAKITPGAVQFYFPNGGNNCLDQNGNGTTHVFGGEQYNWIIIYEQPNPNPPTPPNTYCPSQKMNGNSYTQYIGTIYSPTSSWDILGANTAPLAGQVIAYDAQVTGSGNAGILFNPNYSPAPPAARLVN